MFIIFSYIHILLAAALYMSNFLTKYYTVLWLFLELKSVI